jgi:hypothetical protein
MYVPNTPFTFGLWSESSRAYSIHVDASVTLVPGEALVMQCLAVHAVVQQFSGEETCLGCDVIAVFVAVNVWITILWEGLGSFVSLQCLAVRATQHYPCGATCEMWL